MLILSSIFIVSCSFAGNNVSNVQSKNMAELTSKDDQTEFTLARMTCSDVFDLFEDADPEGKTDLEDVMDAQDDVLDLLTWVNGYLSGRDGIDTNKYTLNKAGIEKTLLSIVEVCKSNEAKRFLDVAPNIK